jgi:hypothetical protein
MKLLGLFPDRSFQLIAITLAVAIAVAAFHMPYGYYGFLRLGVSLTCLMIALSEHGRVLRMYGLIIAIVFNPIWPIHFSKDVWTALDILFAIAFLLFAFFRRNVDRERGEDGAADFAWFAQWGKHAAVVSWALFCASVAMVFYVASFMPHGPSYPTGDTECANDGRGPCGDVYEEDMRGLNIPNWAKFVREDFMLFVVAFGSAGIYFSVGSALASPKSQAKSRSAISRELGIKLARSLRQGLIEGTNLPDHLRLLERSIAPYPTKVPPVVSEPVERAAKALAKCAGKGGRDAWHSYLPMVRTVVEALDEPTASMIDAGNVAMRATWASRGLTAPQVAGDAAVGAAWEAMIDNVLGYP